MKVVLFCGGLGLRLRDNVQNVPKPLARIGARPVLWHLMNYYAHYGHKDFVLCLGYQGEAIKEYFLNYAETLSNDFVLSSGGRDVELLGRDIEDWVITFVDTGLQSSIGQRLVAVRSHVEGEDVFLANYSDGLSDLPLDWYVEEFLRRDRVACFVSVRPGAAFHFVDSRCDGIVTGIKDVGESDIRINGGFFIFRKEVFDFIEDDEDLVIEPFRRLIAERQLITVPYEGFWQCMDTFKDKQTLTDLAVQDQAPWQVWNHKA